MIRFSSVSLAAQPSSAIVQKPAEGRKVWGNREILVPMAHLLKGNNIIDRDNIVKFALAWHKDSQGAIATFSRVVEETAKKLKQRGAKGQETASILTDRFLGFFRREFWDINSVIPTVREFRSYIGTASRGESALDSAKAQGLPLRYGAWREFFSVIRAKAKPEFEAAIETVKQELPEPPTRVIALPG